MALRGTNQEFGRPYNRRIVLESIRLHGPIARGDIASRVGLTVQTVSTIVRELEEHGYVLSLREEPRGRGLPPATLRINPEGGYAVGIHLTPLGIDAALINLSGDVIESTHREAPHATPDHAFDLIGAMVPELTALRPGGRVLGIGMALPGPFGVESMSFVGPTTMAGWKDVALPERLAASTGLPAFFETDMAAAAMGERLYGLGAGYSEYYYLYFGVGLGGVIVHDGAVMRGAWGNAGEIGHIPAANSVPAATMAASNGIFRSKHVAAATSATPHGWPKLRRSSATRSSPSRMCSIPKPSSSAGLRPPTCSKSWSARQDSFPTRSRRGATARPRA
jgi:DNA-binding transcriptional ArsR family regulator